METTQAPSTVTTVGASSSRGIFGTNIPASAAFIIAILLFLLPFAEVKCGNSVMANQTGVGFALASEWKAQGMFNQNDLEKSSVSKKDEPGNSRMIIIAVLVLTLMGVLLSIAKANGNLTALTGLVAAGGLIYFMIDLKMDFNRNIKNNPVNNTGGDGNLFGNSLSDVKVYLEFTPWFWIALVVLILAAIFSWQRSKLST
jgi:hypothetical protein